MRFPVIPCFLVVLSSLPLMGQKVKGNPFKDGWVTVANYANCQILWKPSTIEYVVPEKTIYDKTPKNYVKAWFKITYMKPLKDRSKSYTILNAFQGNYTCAFRTLSYDSSGIALSDQQGNITPFISWSEVVPDTFSEAMSDAIKAEAVRRGFVTSIENL